MSQLVPNNSAVRGVLRRLRPPCSRSATLSYTFSFDQRVNPGLTLQFPSGESARAAGGGRVVGSGSLKPFWAYLPGSTHATNNSYQVVIDHGAGVRTVVHGLQSVAVGVGQNVTRGQVLGTTLNSEVFFAVLFNESPYDPTSINRHFSSQDGNKVIGQGGMLRYAPDIGVRDLSDGIMSTLISGLRYFVPLTCAKPPFLVNIDFNGNGEKVGLAATGISASDYWNVYTAVDFTQTNNYIGCIGSTFNISPVVPLQNYAGVLSTARLERVSPMTDDAGSDDRFDEMLSTWIGGDNGAPIENTFKVKGLPAGTYTVYLYAGESGETTDFYTFVNSGTPALASVTPTAATSFILNDNYVAPQFVLSAQDVLTIKAVGYWAGMQIRRT